MSFIIDPYKFSSAASSVIPIENIVEYWNMNGNADGYNGNNGTLGTSTTFPTSTLIDEALDIDKTIIGGKVDVSNSSGVFSFGNGSNDVPFSVSFWFKLDTVGTSYFISIAESGTNNEYAIYYGSSVIEFHIYDQGINDGVTNKRKRRTSFTPVANVWYHIVCTYSGVQTEWGKVYVNNVLGPQQELGANGYVAMSHTGQKVTMGTANTNSAFTLNGQMDEVAILNIELTASQVTDLYNAGLAGTPIIG